MGMKFADEMRKLCRRNKITIYYERLLGDIKEEAFEGGTHKVITIASTYYNEICRRLTRDGFKVMIYNYNEANTSYMTYIVWDEERFYTDLKESTDINPKNFHTGLVSQRINV